MRIVATSDLHGALGGLEIPECDLLMIAGDVCPIESHTRRYQESWLTETFVPWLDSLPCQEVVLIAGNHDFVLEEPPIELLEHDRLHYLEDSGLEIDGLKIWGSPWVKPVGPGGWAFSIGEQVEPEEQGQDWQPTLARDDLGQVHSMREHSRRHGVSLERAFSRIPDDTNILVTHSPPYGICDDGIYPFETRHYGSRALRARVEEVQPQIHICGHIHEGYGRRIIGPTRVANVARMDAHYRPVNSATVFEIE
jgi:Icc-related predicted phosphoesterase